MVLSGLAVDFPNFVARIPRDYAAAASISRAPVPGVVRIAELIRISISPSCAVRQPRQRGSLVRMGSGDLAMAADEAPGCEGEQHDSQCGRVCVDHHLGPV